MTPLADQLVQYLADHGHVGRANPVTQADAACDLGVPPRELQEAMAEVDPRHLVASACDAPAGIYLCETAAEAARYERQLISRIRAIAQTVRRVRAWLRWRADAEALDRRPPADAVGQLLFPVNPPHWRR